jgi:hypothetical protein
MRFIASLFLDCLLACFGTAVLESAAGHFVAVRSMAEILLKEYGLSFGCALFLGYLLFRLRQKRSSLWTFVPGIVWITISALYVFLKMDHSVLSAQPSMAMRMGFALSSVTGANCRESLSAQGCTSWLGESIPAVRLIAYAIGASLSLKLCHTGGSPVANAIVGNFEHSKTPAATHREEHD